tara:strand:- start:1342 stop:1605 length:264 start_codon:yes stop_codon:yes gene_type:complete
MSSQKFILQTFCMLLENIPEDKEEDKKGFQNVGDSIVHTAPEIIHTAWKRMFNYCSENFNDDTCDWHTKMRDLYNSRYDEWVRLESK